MDFHEFSYPPDHHTIGPLLQKETRLQNGQILHDYIIKIGLNRNLFLENMTLNMYGRCGALHDAHGVFLRMPKGDPASWNAMISVYAQHGHAKDALQLFSRMRKESVDLTAITFMSVLNACNNPMVLEEGVIIHACMVEAGYEANESLGTALIGMYGKCESVDAACVMFEKLYDRSAISWTSMISVFANNGHSEDAFKVLEGMLQAGVVPSSTTFLGVLSAIYGPVMLDMGNTIHACIIKSGLESNPLLGTTLVKMYGKCAVLGDAQYVFDNLLNRTVISWNVMIDVYAQNQEGEKALQLFWQMQQKAVKADDATFVSALSACLSLEALKEGKLIHASIKESKCERNVVVATALVNMYGKCGDLKEAYSIFESMDHRNTVSWNTIIGAYTQHHHCAQSLQLFYRMLEEGVMVNKVTYLSILSACESLSSLVEAMRFHARIVGSDFERDTSLETAITNVYGKCGDLKQARLQFDRIREHNPVSWNVMLNAYVQHGHGKEALELFRKMQQDEVRLDQSAVVSALAACTCLSACNAGMWIHTLATKLGLDLTVDVGTALVNMYGKWGALEEASALFRGLSVRNIATWNALIGACTKNGCDSAAIELVQNMKAEQVEPDRITFVSILSACANLSAIIEGKVFHAWIVSNGIEWDPDVGTSLVSMYGKCGDLEAAHSAFDKMHEQNVVAWNSMLTAYAQHGLGKEAYNLYLCMLHKGPRPDAITFLSVLSACSHAGLLYEGLKCFASMRFEYNIQPKIEHFGCIVDLYGRCGELKEAERFIFRMCLERHAVVWRILLGACQLHNNLSIGRHAAGLAMELDPEDPAPLVLLSNLLSQNGMWDEIEVLKRRMIERDLEKSFRCSKIFVSNKEHMLLDQDALHPESFTQLENLMKNKSCQHGTRSNFHDFEEHYKTHSSDFGLSLMG